MEVAVEGVGVRVEATEGGQAVMYLAPDPGQGPGTPLPLAGLACVTKGMGVEVGIGATGVGLAYTASHTLSCPRGHDSMEEEQG